MEIYIYNMYVIIIYIYIHICKPGGIHYMGVHLVVYSIYIYICINIYIYVYILNCQFPPSNIRPI